ncbi:DUF1403 family protein [Tropicimonas sp.]|uniref:DUF1403 family protein n=1 Tax=Tropicimonas sp. TaxID=2067044 RepID=UPI003A8B2435
MTGQSRHSSPAGQHPPAPPHWIGAVREQGLAAAAFRSGAALAALHPWVAAPRDDLPQALLRDRLALRAAEACVMLSGRTERAAELRDEVHLARPGETPGPAGRIFALWRKAAVVPLRGRWQARLAEFLPETVVAVTDGPMTGADPVAGAVDRLARLLAEYPHEEPAAMILADASLASALGWERLVPLFALRLSRRDLRAGRAELHMAAHRAVAAAAVEAARSADSLTHRAARLRAVAPRLRARGAADAVALFLSEDALSPAIALSPVIRGRATPMSDRAARRLCDRLVALGAVQELTGRASFRLYGL